jgi:hypothetical protein
VTSNSLVPTSTAVVPVSSSSVPIGGIVAGAVVGGIAIIGILSFTWYKVKTRQPVNPPVILYPTSQIAELGSPTRKENVYPTRYEAYDEQPDVERHPPIRYPENVSANLRNE